jgi:hypothetical protein
MGTTKETLMLPLIQLGFAQRRTIAEKIFMRVEVPPTKTARPIWPDRFY